MIRIVVLICAFFGLVVSQYQVSALFTTDGCGMTKGCLQLDDNCDPKSPDCTFFSWTYVSNQKSCKYPKFCAVLAHVGSIAAVRYNFH